ncbi:hypothetical protein AX15_000584 [Amanita polypyramis BW_CC]|nr:hypothetical protein AX15_000584 [Amanita polypyramis BW_CC]
MGIYMKMGKAARKYDMDETKKKLKELLKRDTRNMLATEPLRAFAIAVHLDWKEMMKDAAWNTLAVPFRDLSRCEKLRLLSASDYHDLIQWRFAFQDAVGSLFDSNKVNWVLRALRTNFREELEATDKSVLNIISKTHSLSYHETLQGCEFLIAEIDKTISMVPLRIGARFDPPSQDQS